MGDWNIRRASPTDAEALARCVDAAYAEYAARIPDLPAVSAGLAEEIATHQVWLAEEEGRVIGGLVLIPDDGFMRLANVAVHPDRAGRGLGGTLIGLAETESRNQGFREMRLNTHVDLPENVRLYEHLGWETTGVSGNKVAMRKVV